MKQTDLVLTAVALASVLFTACSKTGDPGGGATASVSASTVAAPAPPAPQLPEPFSAVKIGMTRAELEAAFPPRENVADCKLNLVGSSPALPPEVPGQEKVSHSRCARPTDVAGLAITEAKQFATGAAAYEGSDGDGLTALTLAAAQVRGSLRAGTVTEAGVVEATKGRVRTTHNAALMAAATLVDGAASFVKPRNARRPLMSVLADDCTDFDSERMRAYVAGTYSLGEIDGAARRAVAKCRGPYQSREKELRVRFIARSGALGPIGIARASQPTRKLDAATPATFAVYQTRAQLDGPVARFGVALANGLPEAEKFWSGTVVLSREDHASPWGDALVTLRQGRVQRVVVNVGRDEALGELAQQLGGSYGAGKTAGTVTTWALAGVTARLDIGAPLSLVVQGPPGAEATPSANAAASSSATSKP